MPTPSKNQSHEGEKIKPNLKKHYQREMIVKLVTNNWNKTTPREQDRAILFMLRVLSELSEHRKHGYSKDFWAQYP